MAEEKFDIKEELKKLPASPGVYLMRDSRDEIIYVGKALSLKNRVPQYFQSSRVQRRGPKIEQMVEKIDRFEYIVTDSEMEALVLENNLIKEHRPRYNTMLTDDKTYPFIKATVGEDFPRLIVTRKMTKDKSRYFGPFTSAAAVKDTIDLINKIYGLRTCNRSLPKEIGADRPCLNYHMKQCCGPCTGNVTKEEYRERIEKNEINRQAPTDVSGCSGKPPDCCDHARHLPSAGGDQRCGLSQGNSGSVYGQTGGIRSERGRLCAFSVLLR